MASNYTYNKIDSNTFSRKPTSPTILISTKPVSQSVNLFIAKFLINQRSSPFINFQTRVSPLLRDEFINRHRLKLIRIPRRRSWWWMQVEFIVTPRLRSPLIIYIKKTSFLSFPLLFIPRIDRLHRPDDDSRDERDWFDYLVQGITRSFQFLRREKERERERLFRAFRRITTLERDLFRVINRPVPFYFTRNKVCSLLCYPRNNSFIGYCQFFRNFSHSGDYSLFEIQYIRNWKLISFKKLQPFAS